MAINTKFEYSIRASRDFVFEWFTDLSPEDTKIAEPLKVRKIISRSSTEIRLQDVEEMLGRRIKLDVQVLLNRPAYHWTAIYKSDMADARAEYQLSAEAPDRSGLKYESKLMLKGSFANLLSPFIGLAIKRTFKKELDIFTRAIELDFVDQVRKVQQS